MKSNSYISFIKELEQLKNVTRMSWTSKGRRESTAEHSWRLAVFAGIMLEEFPNLDAKKVLMMALVHDIGELYEGDKPAITKPDSFVKYNEESKAVQKIASLLEEPFTSKLVALWEEYEKGETKEAKLVKALDKAETIIQHNQGENPPDFDYKFNLQYGKELFYKETILQEIRSQIDMDTNKKIENQARKIE